MEVKDVVRESVRQKLVELCGEDPASQGFDRRVQDVLNKYDLEHSYDHFITNEEIHRISRVHGEVMDYWTPDQIKADRIARDTAAEQRVLGRKANFFETWLKGKGGKDNCPDGPGGSKVEVTEPSSIPVKAKTKTEEDEALKVAVIIGGLALVGVTLWLSRGRGNPCIFWNSCLKPVAL